MKKETTECPDCGSTATLQESEQGFRDPQTGERTSTVPDGPPDVDDNFNSFTERIWECQNEGCGLRWSEQA